MGHAIASAFVAAGHPTTTWNRTASRPTPDGAERVQDADSAVRASKTVVVCVIDYDAVRSVLTTARGDVAWAARRERDERLAGRGPRAGRMGGRHTALTYTDGSIMTPTDTIGTPAAVVLYSGTRDGGAGGTRWPSDLPGCGAGPGGGLRRGVAGHLLDVGGGRDARVRAGPQREHQGDRTGAAGPRHRRPAPHRDRRAQHPARGGTLRRRLREPPVRGGGHEHTSSRRPRHAASTPAS